MSPDGRYLASAGECLRFTRMPKRELMVSPLAEDHRIILWDIGSGRAVKHMTGHTGTIESMAFSADSSVLTSGGLDCTVRCWDVKGTGGLSSMARGGVLGDGIQDPFAAQLLEPTSPDLLATYHTKRTPITTTQFTPRNLCLTVGTYVPEEGSRVV